ncbi:MAG: hypothetical protein HKL99_14180 [Burkholderiales bacterium]|nr:hypothetical protein [Burkholderiales bacterium]
MAQALTTYGAVVFDDPAIHDGGWLCLEGQAPCRIRGTIDVADDRILLTNVDPVVIRTDGLSARFRGADWGPIRLGDARTSEAWALKASVLSEMGWAEMSAQERASRMAVAMGRWMRATHTLYPAVVEAHKFGLAHTLRAARPKDVIGMAPAPVLRATEMAYTFGCAAERPPGAERFRRVGTVVPPRYDHAMALLSAPVPENGCAWRIIPKREIPQDNAEIAEWVESRGPLLVQMVVDRITHPVAHQLLNPAGEATPELGRRLWRTGEEAIAFSTMGEVRINAAFEADASVIPAQELPEALRDLDPALVRASPSMSLFMTALHKSYMISDIHFPDKKRGYRKSPAEIFLRARDMLLCARHAIALHQAGFGVVWYGSSSISVSVPDDLDEAKETLFAAATSTGLLTAAGTMPPQRRDELLAACCDDNGVLRFVLLEGNAAKVDELDATMFENIMDRLQGPVEAAEDLGEDS